MAFWTDCISTTTVRPYFFCLHRLPLLLATRTPVTVGSCQVKHILRTQTARSVCTILLRDNNTSLRIRGAAEALPGESAAAEMPPEAPSCRRAQSARPRARFCRRSVSLLLVLAALAAARGATAEVDDYDARRSSPENRTEQLGSAVSTRQRSGADTQVTEQSARNAAGERAAAVEGLSQDAAGEANDAGKRERKKKKGRNLDAATQDPQAPPGLDEVSTAPLVSAELSGPTPASSATGGGEEENLPGEENGDRAEGESRVSNAARDIRNGELGLQDNPTLYSDVQLVDALPNQSTDTSSSLAVNTGPDPGLGQGSPMYESLRNRKAQAKIKDASGKDLGAISFEWCHNTEQRFGLNTAINVLVAVDLPSCSFLWSGDSHAGESNGTNCAYQISSGHIEGPATGETCSSVSEVYDPMKAAVQRQRARQDEPGLILEELFGVLTDRCDSTFNSDKLTSCPAGSLSRQHGTGNMYFDYNLGIHNDIVGRSLLLAKSISGSPDYSLHCSPITFWDNCATSGPRPSPALPSESTTRASPLCPSTDHQTQRN